MVTLQKKEKRGKGKELDFTDSRGQGINALRRKKGAEVSGQKGSPEGEDIRDAK